MPHCSEHELSSPQSRSILQDLKGACSNVRDMMIIVKSSELTGISGL